MMKSHESLINPQSTYELRDRLEHARLGELKAEASLWIFVKDYTSATVLPVV